MDLEYHPENLAPVGRALGAIGGLFIGICGLVLGGGEILSIHSKHLELMRSDVQYRQEHIEKQERIDRELYDIRTKWAKYGIIGR